MAIATADFETLYQAHYAGVHRFVYRFVQNAALADELTQDAFLKAYQARDTFRGDASEKTWLLRIARNACLDWLRSPRARAARSDSLDEVAERGLDPGDDRGMFLDSESPPSVEQKARMGEMSSCVQGFIATLPESLRTPLILHDMEGLTNKEIASVLDCSLDAAKMRLHRGRQRLKQMMNERCDLFSDERGVFSCLPAPPAPDVPPVGSVTGGAGDASS